MQFRLRTLLIVLAVGPVVLAARWLAFGPIIMAVAAYLTGVSLVMLVPPRDPA